MSGGVITATALGKKLFLILLSVSFTSVTMCQQCAVASVTSSYGLSSQSSAGVPDTGTITQD